jgi:putative solute:sodium symporter small subunit
MRSKEVGPSDGKRWRVNILRPLTGYMRREVLLIWFMLLGLGGVTFGFQLLLVLLGETPAGEGPLTAASFFGFPLHFWFTGQFLILWFIVLCLLYNLFIDRLTEKFRKRR